MGRIKIILKKEEVSSPKLNNRLTCELCENIHIHYRNIRIEFTKDEFLHILRLLQSIDINEVENFHYSDWAYKEIIKDFELPDKTYYNNRLQIEQQMEGHYHIHYRNVRLEFDNLTEIGFPKYFGWYKKSKYYLKNQLQKIKMYIISHIYKPKPFSKLKKLGLKIDDKYLDAIKDYNFYTYKIKTIKIKDLKCSLLTKDGWHTYSIAETPEYKFLQGDCQAYIDYCNYKNSKIQGDIHSVQRFNKLLTSLQTNGYDDKSCIIINQDNIIIDGKHRVCWLQNKYGKHKKIRVLKLYMQSQLSAANKNFVYLKKHSIGFKRHTNGMDGYNFVSFEYKSQQNTTFQIYYTQNSEDTFSEEKSIIVHVQKTKHKTNTISFGIYAENLSALRIDAGLPGNIICISNIVIKKQNQEKKLDIKKFICVNMNTINKTAQSITFKPTSDDPHLVYKKIK